MILYQAFREGYHSRFSCKIIGIVVIIANLIPRAHTVIDEVLQDTHSIWGRINEGTRIHNAELKPVREMYRTKVLSKLHEQGIIANDEIIQSSFRGLLSR